MKNLLGFETVFFNNSIVKTPIQNSKDSLYQIVVPRNIASDIYTLNFYGVQNRILPYKLIRIYPSLYDSALYLAWNTIAVPKILQNVVTFVPGRRFAFALQSNGSVIGWDTSGRFINNLPIRFDSTIIDIGLGGTSQGTQYILALKSDGTTTSWAERLSPEIVTNSLVKIFPTRNYHFGIRTDSSVFSFGSFPDIEQKKMNTISAYIGYLSFNILPLDTLETKNEGGVINLFSMNRNNRSTLTLSSGNQFTIVLYKNGSINSLGDTNSTDLISPRNEQNISQIATNANATIALKNTNSLKTFGMNIDTPMKNNQIISVFGQGDVASYHYMRFIKLETQVINGFITPSSNIKAYSNVLVTFSPIENYSVDSIWIDGIYNDALTKQNPSSYIFDTVVDNHSIIVKYRQNEIIIKSLKFGNGFITPLGNTNVRYGDSLKFTIKYADTVLYDSLVVDKRQVTKDTVYVFRNITDTHTIIAYFRDATVPDSPRNARALPSNSCALINFDPPLNDGGLPILKYVVTSTSNGLNLRDTITSTSVQICGLTNGLPYQFFIRAINIKGASLPTRTNVVVPTDGFKIINVRVVNGKTPSNFISIADGLDTLISFQNDTGYSLDSIYINNVFNPILTAQKLTNYTFVNVTGDSSIRVVYKLDSFKIYTSVVNGFITPRDSFKTTFKDLAEVGFSPATFYILDSIFINKKYDTKLTRLNATSYTFRKVLGDSSIRVVYKKQILNITTSVVNGQISASRDIDFFDSIRVTYLKENDNYIIDSVIVDGMLRNDSMQGFTFRNIQNSHSIKVVYKLKSFIISTLAINGIITPTFSVKVLSNPRVTYSGVDFTYRLDSVWINNIYSRSASDSIRGYTFNNVRGDSSIRVSFKKNTFIIRSSKLGGGQILPLGDVEVFPDSNQTFVIMYPDTIVYDSLVVDGIKVIKRDTFTFFNVSMNHTIQAYFSDVNVPDSPQNAQAVAGSSKATISFSLPLSNGGAPILFYTISYFNNGNLIEMQVPNAGSYVISGLSNDQAYTFNIYAHNIKGRSLPARTNAVVPILDLKSIFVTKIYDDTTYLDTLKIEINRDTIINYQPLSNYIIDSVFINNVYYENLKSLTMYQFRDIRGDSGIKIKYKYTGYTITTQVFGNGTVTPLWIIKIGANRDTSVSISHSNLSIYDSLVIDNENINDTPSIYNFTNVTSNHTLKAYFTKIGRPDSPQMARAVAGNSKASILFAYPLSDSGGKVLFYTVYSTSNGIQIQISNPNAPILISGLTNGLSYDFLVTATNIAGESDAAHIYNVVPQAHLILVNTEVINGTITPSFSTLINTDSTIHYQGELGTILDSIYINGRYDSQITADSITAYTFKNIRDDSAIKVVYKIRQFNILTSAVHGYISMPFKVNYNMDARVSFQPDAGYTLDSVFINNRYIQDISNKFSYIFKNVTADSVIKVIFKPIVYDIQSAVMGLGNITPLGNVKVRQDSTQIFIISYGDTVRYDSLVVDNIKVMAKDTFIFPNVRTHHTIVAYFTEIKVPDSPQNAMATVLNKSAEISFNTPLSDGGAPILYYKIYYDSLGILVFLDTTTWSPIIIKNLVDKPYTFYIKAVNRRGESLPARTQTVQPTNYNYIFISKIYNTLTIDTIQVNNGQDTTLTILGLPNFVADSVFYNGVYQSNLKGFNNITLHFQNITGDSFVRIVYRFVNGFKLITKVYGNGTISPSGTSFIFANTDTTVTISHPVNSRYDSIKINGILQDTLFLKYPIRSINKDYLIEAYFSYIGRPDSPQNAIAIPGNRKAVISFDYPKTDSGSVVLYYTIYYTLNGVTQSQTSTNSPVTLSGLINGQTYSIQVTATNIVGESIKTRTFYVTPQANIFIITTEVRNGTITPSFNIRGIPDSTIRYAPLEGYTLDSIYINGIYHAQITRDSISAYTFKNILGDSSIKVVYKLKQFTIHIEVVNGTISGLNQVKYNENILIQFRPTIGYGLDSIYINGIYNNILSMSGVTSYRFDNVKADSSIKVVYKLLYFTITTVVKGGTISDTIRNVIYGSRYKITFNPLKGYFLDSLIINGRYEPEYYNKLIDSYIFNNVLGDSSIYVVFAPKEFDVMSTIGGDVLGGSITPLGINKVKFDGYILFTIDLNYGFVVDSLIIDGVLIPYTKNFEFFNVDSNHTIHVVFRRDLFRITHLSNYGGVFNPAKDTDVNLGNNYTFNVLPFSGYIIDSVFLNDASLPVNNFNNTYFIYTISNVNQFYRVRVVFKQILLSISYRNFKFKITNNSCYGDSIGRIDLNVDSFAYYKYEFIDLNGNISYDSFLGTSFLIGSKLKAGDYTIKIWFKGFQNLFVGTYYLKVTEPKPITEFSSIRIEKKTIILNLEGAPDFYVSINNNTWNLKPSTTSLPLQNGINKIVVKSFKNCLDSIVETIYISSGFNLFPNPANAVINLVFEDAETELNFEVYNNNGQLIDKGFKQFLGGVSAKNIQLNIEGYPSGVYFIKILNGQAKGFYRFIKN
ncbi:MAG: fibronectin type III domain-containing protein [Alphaproteobacteria bacterium]|nr:fibronectin type III domain-containing protein [Alphaproteobacteria bacterium]